MIAEIKQASKKNTPLSPPDVKVRCLKFTTVPIRLYTTIFLLFIVVVTIMFSVRSNQLFSKELVAPVFILGYTLVMQIIEQRAKRTANSPYVNDTRPNVVCEKPGRVPHSLDDLASSNE